MLVPEEDDDWSALIDLPTYEIVLKPRRRTGWRWQVFADSGQLVMQSRAESRAAARYQSARALFLLLSTARPQPPSERRRVDAKLP